MRLQFTPAARADIDHIFDFTLERWGKDQALRYLREIQKCCDGLINGLSHIRSADHVRPGYFKEAVGVHVIYFHQTDAAIVVVRILHQRMDVDQRL